MSKTHRFYVTVAKGMENILVDELKELGIKDPKILGSGAEFVGTLKEAYTVCLWSRLANRVLLPLKTFDCPSPEKLYGGVKSINWQEHMTLQTTLAVDFSSSYSDITHTQFGALKTKDAVVDQFRSIHGARPSVDPSRPGVRINVYLHENKATVSIDLSGESLHRRGYRLKDTGAPLKESLAAAMLRLAGWTTARCEAEGENLAFLDPMCGSGTLPIEAAYIALGIPPAQGRQYYGFIGWKQHSPEAWAEVQKEANHKIQQTLETRKKFPKIIGTDQDAKAIKASLDNLERSQIIRLAQKRNLVHFEKREFVDAICPSPKGVLVVNPPYGERLGEEEALKPLYKAMGDVFKQRFKGWEAYVFTANKELAKSVGLRTSRRDILFNGALECRLLRYTLF